MRSNLLFALVLLLAAGEAALAQRPPRPQGPPPGGIGMPRGVATPYLRKISLP